MTLLRTLACAIATALLSASGSLLAADVAGTWLLRDGAVSYEVSHVMHGAVGRSRAVQGEAQCEARRCSFRLVVPMASFASGDGDRDREMLAATHAERYPQVTVEGAGRLVAEDAAVVKPTVVLAGRRVTLEPVRVHVERGWWRLRVRGSFTLALSAFGIERPALLAIPISDTVWIHLELNFAAD